MNQHQPLGCVVGCGEACSTVRVVCLGVLAAMAMATACAVADTTNAAVSHVRKETIVNPVIVTCPAGWKYKHGKKFDRISGKAVTPFLVPYLTNGWSVGIARYSNGDYYNVVSLHPLATKNNKSFTLKIKNKIMIRYNAKSGAFSYTIWSQLPPDFVVYLGYPEYLLIDVSPGLHGASFPYEYLTAKPDLSAPLSQWQHIVLRRMQAGRFTMGSPAGELGRYDTESPQHTVTFTKPFYMSLFEINQGQYMYVALTNPSMHGAAIVGWSRPVENVSWSTIRGGTWPGGTPVSNTFVYTLRAKTGLAFDLPTEAQWEYACRAGTTKALNNNMNLTNTLTDGNMNVLGRYQYNGGIDSQHTNVGSYIVNNWGLYDMHGNVAEWCLDWFSNRYTGAVTNPVGPASGSGRVLRGGCWYSDAGECRSAQRYYWGPSSTMGLFGFRIVVPEGQ